MRKHEATVHGIVHAPSQRQSASRPQMAPPGAVPAQSRPGPSSGHGPMVGSSSGGASAYEGHRHPRTQDQDRSRDPARNRDHSYRGSRDRDAHRIPGSGGYGAPGAGSSGGGAGYTGPPGSSGGGGGGGYVHRTGSSGSASGPSQARLMSGASYGPPVDALGLVQSSRGIRARRDPPAIRPPIRVMPSSPSTYEGNGSPIESCSPPRVYSNRRPGNADAAVGTAQADVSVAHDSPRHSASRGSQRWDTGPRRDLRGRFDSDSGSPLRMQSTGSLHSSVSSAYMSSASGVSSVSRGSKSSQGSRSSRAPSSAWSGHSSATGRLVHGASGNTGAVQSSYPYRAHGTVTRSARSEDAKLRAQRIHRP